MDALPAATQTGAQTFGCLINGEPFVPPSFGSNRPNAFYQFVDGAYTLSIYGSSGGGNEMISIGLGTIDNLEIIEQGQSYELIEREIPNYFVEVVSQPNMLITTSYSGKPGVLTITRFDESIISGTFEFTILDNDGNEINITDGRFDLNYTN